MRCPEAKELAQGQLYGSCVISLLLLTHQQELSFQSLNFLTGQMGLINTSEDCDLDSLRKCV